MFVLGRLHSGTTLVQLMLHARPRIALPPETLPHGLKGTGPPTCSPPTKDGRPSAIRRTGGHLDHQADARSDRAERGRIGRRTLDRLARVREPGPAACRPGTG
ncbi:hypothetical protein ACFXMT_35810 [Streptomyces mirabilis]|uniref:hypothetical protein n=1 Tax=Streptomyces mirabilis TaxID=68239 RepID=UPI00364F54D6